MFSKQASAHWVEQFEALCQRRGITAEERELIWDAMAHICYVQVLEREGPFYEAIAPFFAPDAAADYRQGEE
jgi:hypothetical protein